MGMYENLNRLEPKDDVESVARQLDPELRLFCLDHPVPTSCVTPAERHQFAIGLYAGIQLGLVYAAEFGIPDCTKNTFTVVPA